MKCQKCLSANCVPSDFLAGFADFFLTKMLLGIFFKFIFDQKHFFISVTLYLRFVEFDTKRSENCFSQFQRMLILKECNEENM